MSGGPRSTDLTTSAELIGLLERAHRLATSAGRPEPLERLGRARTRVTSRAVRIAVVGAPGQGVSTLVGALAAVSTGRSPGPRFFEMPGHPRSGAIAVPDPAAADAVLLVSDAGQQYTRAELDALGRIRAQGLPVAGVLSKIDAFPQWADAQRADRAQLQAAGLDSPPIPLLPVSVTLAQSARQRGDESLEVASGIPQLVEFLRDRMSTRVDATVRDAVVGDVRAAADLLGGSWNGELTALGGDAGSSGERQRRAVAELERRQQLSAEWQIALGDGWAELAAQAEHDLRDKLRAVVRLAEADIARSDPLQRWDQFDLWLRQTTAEGVRANFQLTRELSRQLAEQVAARLTGQPEGSTGHTALPDLRLNSPDETLSQFTPLPQPEIATGGPLARVVNSLRGSYGGILMVGVLTSLAGMKLINGWSVVAGLLLGGFTFWEDRKSGKERAKAEAKMAVSKHMDEVIFQVSDVLRAELRRVHRQLRDHFTVINDQRLRTASDAVRAVETNGVSDARLAALRANLAELRQIQARLLPPSGPPASPRNIGRAIGRAADNQNHQRPAAQPAGRV